MRNLSVCLLLCAVMALGKANDNNETVSVVHHSGNPMHPHLVTFAQPHFQGTCSQGWSEISGRCYFFNTQGLSWAQAQQNCQSMGGNLASIQSSADYNSVQQLTGPTKPETWIGGSDCQEVGSWFWIDGTGSGFTYWCGAQPDGRLPECCLQMNTGAGQCWDDQSCTKTLPSVCVK